MIPEDPYGEIQMLVSELPDSANTIAAKAREFRDADEVDFAYQLLKLAIAKDPAPMLRAAHADLLLRDGMWDEALHVARECEANDPSQVHGRRILKRVLLQGLPESASTIARTAVAHDDVTFAEQLLQEGVDAEPENIILLEQLARHYATQRQVADCIITLQQLLEVEPGHDEALLMLAGAFIKQGDLPRGQKLLNKARKRGVSSRRLEELEKKIGEVVNVISQAKKS